MMNSATYTTLVIHHVFSALALVIMALRLICRQVLYHKFNFGDYCTMAAMLCAAARDGMIHVVLTWGTNNLTAASRKKINFTPDEIYRRKVGSQLTIANRPIYNSYLWLQKLVLLHFFLTNFHPEERSRRYILWIYSAMFFATYTAAQIVGFTECDPVHLYWQVVPAPGSCVQAQVQLVVLGVLNIVTDVMLLALPLPTLMSLQTPLRTKLRLYIICALGLFIIAITIIRLPINHMNATVQANRSTWASTELLTAALVVNAPILYGAFNNSRRQKKNGASAYKSNPSKFSATHTVGSAAPRTKHGRSALYDDSDDEGLINRMQCQSSVTSDRTVPKSAGQEGIILKTFEVSYSEVENDKAATKPNSRI